MEERRDVRITGIDMGLGQLVVLFTKVGIAIIPAMIIVSVISMIVGMVMASALMPLMSSSMLR